MRRDHRNRRQLAGYRGAQLSPFERLFAVGDSWFDADNVETSDGFLDNWVDYLDPTHKLGASGSARCAAPTVDANFSNALTASFNGTSNTYTSTRAASEWAFLHEGAGCDVFLVYRQTDSNNRVLFSTWSSNTALGGFWTYTNLGYLGVQTTGVTVAANGGGVTTNVSTYSELRYRHPTNPNAQVFQKTASVAVNSAANLPIVGAPGQTLRIGNLGAATANWWLGQLRAVYVFRRLLSTDERVVVRGHIAETTGIV